MKIDRFIEQMNNEISDLEVIDTWNDIMLICEAIEETDNDLLKAMSRSFKKNNTLEEALKYGRDVLVCSAELFSTGLCDMIKDGKLKGWEVVE